MAAPSAGRRASTCEWAARRSCGRDRLGVAVLAACDRVGRGDWPRVWARQAACMSTALTSGSPDAFLLR
eukprot:4263961-Prymnesium_polylepis.1